MSDRKRPLPPLSEAQDIAIDFALDRKGAAWFAPPGFGKTRSGLEVIRETDGHTLIFAPKLVCQTVWPAENHRWGYNFSMRFLHGKNRHLRNLPQVSLMNYEAIPWLVDQLGTYRVLPFKQVIFDELSKMKNPSSKRFREWMKIAGRMEYKLGGTGTPVGAHLKDLFGEMLVCDDGASLGTSEARFLRRYFSYDEYTCKLDPYHDSEAEILKLIRPSAISFDINALDMPDLKHLPTCLDMPAECREAYEKMHEDSAHEALELYAVNAAVKSSKLRQMASGGVIDMHGARKRLHTSKAEHLRQILDEHDGRPVLVFMEFLSDYQTICSVLGYEVPALCGFTSERDGVKFVKQWNRGELPVLAAHPKSASYGLNLQDSGNVVIFYTLPWSYEMVNQGIARLWRQGQKNKVLVYYLLIGGTEDERVFARVNEREGTHNRVMQGLL